MHIPSLQNLNFTTLQEITPSFGEWGKRFNIHVPLPFFSVHDCIHASLQNSAVQVSLVVQVCRSKLVASYKDTSPVIKYLSFYSSQRLRKYVKTKPVESVLNGMEKHLILVPVSHYFTSSFKLVLYKHC